MAQTKEEKNAKAKERRAAKAELQRRTAEVEAAEITIAQAADVQEVKAEARKRFPKPTNNKEYLARIEDGRVEAVRSLDETVPLEERLDAAIRARHAFQQLINFAAFNVRDPLMEEMEAQHTG